VEANPGTPHSGTSQGGRGDPERPGAHTHPRGRRYVRWLREVAYENECETGRILRLLVEAGLPFGEVAMLGDEAHREFVQRSGLREDLRACTPGGEDAGNRSRRVRILHRSSPIEGELNREILETLIELGAPWVKVVSEGLTRRGLGSVPEVEDAIREAWLLPEGLRLQLEAVSRGEEIPTWPVLLLVEGMKG
jgi:hypothetical protein